MKLSELRKVIREVIEDEYSDAIESNAKDKVNDLFGGSECVSISDIEDVAYESYKDVDKADKLAEMLISYADGIAAELNYEKVENVGYKKSSTETPTENDINESKLSSLKQLIMEEIKSVKQELDKAFDESFRAILRTVKDVDKNLSVKKHYSSKKFEVIGCLPTQIDIIQIDVDLYDVLIMKAGTDRTKKQNISLKDCKELIKSVLTSTDQTYVNTAFNKSAEASKDSSKKSVSLPETAVNKIKSVSDAKNDEKDFNLPDVKNEKDLPDKPLSEVGSVKKQLDHEESKVKFAYPKQSKDEKKHVVKGGKGKELKLPEFKIKKK